MNKDELITQLLKYLKDVVETGKEQIPLVAQQWLRYSLISAWFWLVIGVILAVVTIKFISMSRKAFRKIESEGDGPGGTIAFTIYACLSGITSIIMGTLNIHILFMIYLAPKVFILQELSQMLLKQN